MRYYVESLKGVFSTIRHGLDIPGYLLTGMTPDIPGYDAGCTRVYDHGVTNIEWFGTRVRYSTLGMPLLNTPLELGDIISCW